MFSLPKPNIKFPDEAYQERNESKSIRYFADLKSKRDARGATTTESDVSTFVNISIGHVKRENILKNPLGNIESYVLKHFADESGARIMTYKRAYVWTIMALPWAILYQASVQFLMKILEKDSRSYTTMRQLEAYLAKTIVRASGLISSMRQGDYFAVKRMTEDPEARAEQLVALSFCLVSAKHNKFLQRTIGCAAFIFDPSITHHYPGAIVKAGALLHDGCTGVQVSEECITLEMGTEAPWHIPLGKYSEFARAFNMTMCAKFDGAGGCGDHSPLRVFRYISGSMVDLHTINLHECAQVKFPFETPQETIKYFSNRMNVEMFESAFHPLTVKAFHGGDPKRPERPHDITCAGCKQLKRSSSSSSSAKRPSQEQQGGVAKRGRV